jgi:hypothetical protein
MRPLTKLIPVYNVDGTANDAGMITDIADVILHYENHSEHTKCKGNLTDSRRILHLSLAKGNPK